MEALVFVFAEIIIACMVPVIAFAGAVASIALELLAGLLGGTSSVWAKRRKARRKQPVPALPRKPLIPRRVVHWGAGLLAAAGVAGAVAAVVFFQPILRHVLQTAAQKAGMEISYDAASGSLLSGHVVLQGIVLRRQGADGPGFDLTVAQAEADVALWSLLGAEPRLQKARVEGVSGFLTPVARPADTPRSKRRKRPFRVDLMQLSTIDVEIRPESAVPYGVRIDTGSVAGFRSRTALFDLLFRSNLRAEIAGQPLLVETRDITEDGRETRWRFEDVEPDALKLIVARAPLTWLKGGVVNVAVEDRWSLSEEWVDMDWQVSLAGVGVAVPETAGAGEKVLAGALAKLVAAQGGNATFQYRLTLDKDDIGALRAGDLQQFWDVVLSGIVKSGGTRSASNPGEVEETPGRLRGAFDKIRARVGRRD